MASISASPCSGPSAIATATARLSAITGLGSSAAVELGDAAPVGDRRDVLDGDRAPARRTGPRPRRRRARAPPRSPSACHSARSWSESSTSRPPASTRASRRAWWSSISASRPRGSGAPGHQLDEQPPEPDRLRAQLAPHERLARRRRVALVEDQVDGGEHRRQPVRQLLLLGHAVGDAGVGDLALGAHEPLRHRGLGHEERARDLRHRQAAERPQRQRHARLGGERRVAAGEHQPQPVVGHLVGRLRRRAPRARASFSSSTRSRRRRSIARLRAVVVIHAPGLRGTPSRGQRSERDDPRLLHRLLGEVEVAEDADERGDRPPRLAPEQAVDVGVATRSS